MWTWLPVVIKILLFAVIPALLIWLSRPEYYGFLKQYWPFSYFVDSPPFCHFLLFLTGTLLAALISPVLLARSESKNVHIKEQRDALVSLCSRTFLSVFRSLANDNDLQIDVYVPEKPSGSCERLKFVWCNSAEFVMRGRYKPVRYFVATDFSNNAGLRFEVYPNPEGLIGKAYAECLPVQLEKGEKLSLKQDRLRHKDKCQVDTANNETAASLQNGTYWVTSEQRNKANDWALWICVPACTQDRVELIVSLHGPNQMAADKCKEVTKKMVIFGDDLCRYTIRETVHRSL
jgi:hypothetical protein